MELRTVKGRKSLLYKTLLLLDEHGRERAEDFLRVRGLLNPGERLYSYETRVSDEIGSDDGIPLCFKVLRE